MGGTWLVAVAAVATIALSAVASMTTSTLAAAVTAIAAVGWRSLRSERLGWVRRGRSRGARQGHCRWQSGGSTGETSGEGSVDRASPDMLQAPLLETKVGHNLLQGWFGEQREVGGGVAEVFAKACHQHGKEEHVGDRNSKSQRSSERVLRRRQKLLTERSF
jgi:hypothetical protein